MRDTFYYPSTAPGKTWAISVGKVPGRPATVSATEGDYTPAKAGGFASFSFMMFGARTRRREISGPATAKKKAAAVDALVAELKAEGLIAVDAA